ncbi:MAG: phosphatase PAP2 family protein [Thermoleophilia bacterium]|nr:phosphatase PAP2 family protein [Thermoleophilia bacterium]
MRGLSGQISRVGRALPRGFGDFLLQLGIWLGFLLAYQVARGIAGRGSLEAFHNGRVIVDLEQRLHALIELDLQRVVLSAGDAVVQAVNWTYWNSQFTVVGLALLWVYCFRNNSFLRVRNVLLLANLLALVGFALLPTAPPRLFPELGFVDTLAASSALNHGSGLIQLASNQFAAMPSVHSADALILGFFMAGLVSSRLAKVLWTLWPSWVWFTVMATANHFWLDVAAGIGLAALSTSLVYWAETARRRDSAFDRLIAR